MIFRMSADAVLILHLAFILFVLTGAALTLWWRWTPMVHLPAAAWGCFVELTGRVCPLTYLENYLRAAAGESGYAESFIEHYLIGIMYPAVLTQEIQYALAGLVVIVNAGIYLALFFRWRALR